jgi:hypothetical protein
MKTPLFYFIINIFCCFSTFGQLVSTEPKKPIGNEEVTIIIDLKKAKNPLAKDLLGKKSDVYLWSGVGPILMGDPFKIKPADQIDFYAPYPKGKMTSMGDDKWSIKLIPRVYFSVPDSLNIKTMGIVVKSGDGKAQTEDLYIRIHTK